jgi:CHAT domain-containing protein/tetratricopeptide (TPR) repeat protein
MTPRWVRSVVAPLTLLALLLGGAVVEVQGADDLAVLQKQVGQLYDQGKYTEAIPIAKRYVNSARRKHGETSSEFAAAINLLALVYKAQGNYSEAEPLYQRAAETFERTLGAEHPDTLWSLSNLAALYATQGRHREAEPLMKRVLEGRERTLGAEHPDTLNSLNNLAFVYQEQGRYDRAEPLYKRAMEGFERTLGADAPDTLISVDNLGELYREWGRYEEAEPLIRRALQGFERTRGAEHPETLGCLVNLAALYHDQGRYSDAEPLYKRAAEGYRRTLGAEHPLTLTSVSNLATISAELGRRSEAEALLKRVLAGRERTLGAEHPDTLGSVANLGALYKDEGRYGEAEEMLERARKGYERVLGAEHPSTLQSVDSLASLYELEGRYGDAERLYKNVLAGRERALGAEHPETLVSINDLAVLYGIQGRYTEAEPLLKRALEVTERKLGKEHRDALTSVTNLARLYQEEQHYDEAEPLFKRALEGYEHTLGPEHPETLNSLNNLASLYVDTGRYAQARALYKRALEGRERTLGPEHLDTLASVNNLAALYRLQSRYSEAEPLFKRAVAGYEHLLGAEHPDTLKMVDNLAGLYFVQSDWEHAAQLWRRSTTAIARRTMRDAMDVGQSLTGKKKSEAQRSDWQFRDLAKSVYRLSQTPDGAASREMFVTAQWAQSSEAAQSLAQMAARGATGDAALTVLVRERQDLVEEWHKRDELRNAWLGQAPEKRQASAEADNDARLAMIDNRIAEIDTRLTVDFPGYASLASPEPLSVEAVQAQLRTDEALVLFLDTPPFEPSTEETFIWVVTKTDVRWVRSELGTPALVREVSALRCGLDYDGAWFEKGAWDGARCNSLVNLKKPYGIIDHDLFHKPLPFDLERAYMLYKALFGKAEDLIEGKHLLIIPSGPLTQLPFQVLVTKAPSDPLPASTPDYRDAAWLVREHAITVLPAVSSLKAVRELAKESHAGELYIGFGNPLLDGDVEQIADGETRAKRLAEAKRAREARCEPIQPLQTAESTGAVEGNGQVTRGPDGLANLADLRKWSPLPETADELCNVANILGIDPTTHVYIGVNAREKELKRLSEGGQLARYKIVHFATHGALAGQLSPTAEPGLLLTPPNKPSETDDGYLSASEVAALKLDADWVILSACNTAAGDAKSAEALSGLARAFIYAGTRSLLVSHWYVSSMSTVPLITTAIAMLTVDPKLGRAEALRRSMLSLITSGKGYEAHPAFWAPFVLVGEGAPTP